MRESARPEPVSICTGKTTYVLLTPVNLLGLEHDEAESLQRGLLLFIADLHLLYLLRVIITDRVSRCLVKESGSEMAREPLPLLKTESLPVEIREERSDRLLRSGRGGRVEMNETSDSDLVACR